MGRVKSSRRYSDFIAERTAHQSVTPKGLSWGPTRDAVGMEQTEKRGELPVMSLETSHTPRSHWALEVMVKSWDFVRGVCKAKEDVKLLTLEGVKLRSGKFRFMF